MSYVYLHIIYGLQYLKRLLFVMLLSLVMCVWLFLLFFFYMYTFIHLLISYFLCSVCFSFILISKHPNFVHHSYINRATFNVFIIKIRIFIWFIAQKTYRILPIWHDERTNSQIALLKRKSFWIIYSENWAVYIFLISHLFVDAHHRLIWCLEYGAIYARKKTPHKAIFIIYPKQHTSKIIKNLQQFKCESFEISNIKRTRSQRNHCRSAEKIHTYLIRLNYYGTHILTQTNTHHIYFAKTHFDWLLIRIRDSATMLNTNNNFV